MNSGTSKTLSGETNGWVCEESNSMVFCAVGGTAETRFDWSILGSKQHEYKFAENPTHGNRVKNRRCVNIEEFPQLNYYPQWVTIRVRSYSGGEIFVEERRIELLDCNHDDSTCEDFHDFSAITSKQEEGNKLSHSIQPIDNALKTYSSYEIFDVSGRLIYSANNSQINFENLVNVSGLFFIRYYDSSKNVIKVEKRFLSY